MTSTTEQSSSDARVPLSNFLRKETPGFYQMFELLGEQISGQLPMDSQGQHISYEAVYQFIYDPDTFPIKEF